ncbi:hypothetical protein [Halalkalibacter alkalisediminis]|uniref:Uncharacterized protein n=1 Tax=Halalkalibacter alkalisediminis TaxID=935616 RepID=A0ABV6NKE2_9BACI|nr:hypothetical protein [Halalkalibacter alkalisediminis]
MVTVKDFLNADEKIRFDEVLTLMSCTEDVITFKNEAIELLKKSAERAKAFTPSAKTKEGIFI